MGRLGSPPISEAIAASHTATARRRLSRRTRSSRGRLIAIPPASSPRNIDSTRRSAVGIHGRWAISSAVEHSLHTGGAAGSTPASPTIFPQYVQRARESALPFPPLNRGEQNPKVGRPLGENRGSEFTFRSFCSRLPEGLAGCGLEHWRRDFGQTGGRQVAKKKQHVERQRQNRPGWLSRPICQTTPATAS